MNIATNIPQMANKRKSLKLTKDEHKALKAFCKTFSTVVECAEAIGISRQVLDLVLLKGSGSPETIEKIKGSISVG
jgi:hypothetical protein